MSGLLSYASPWNTNTTTNSTRKRVPTISSPSVVRNNNTTTQKNYPKLSCSEETDSKTSNENSMHSFSDSTREYFTGVDTMITPSIESAQEENNTRVNRIQGILEKMHNTMPENDGAGLVNFRPPSLPTSASLAELQTFAQIDPPVSNSVPKIASYAPDLGGGQSTPYGAYRDVYQPNSKIGSYPYPRMALMGGGDHNNNNSKSFGGVSDKVMDKLNYMVHLLEQQQHEPTQHLMEEFILYTFLGVFAIYLCDSFARAGKYIR